MGMAIFSRFPIVAHGLITLTDHKSQNQCIYVDIKKGAKVIRVYNVHLQSIRFDPYDYRYINNITAQGQPEAKFWPNDWVAKLKVAFIKRSEQVFKIKTHADSCTYPYIISGDFNDTPRFNFAVNQMS